MREKAIKTISLFENRSCVETKPDYDKPKDDNLYDEGPFREKIRALSKNAELCRSYKKEVLTYVKRLEDQYEAKVFTYAEFEYLLNQYLKGHPLEYWVAYYHSVGKKIKQMIRQMNKEKGCGKPKHALSTPNTTIT